MRINDPVITKFRNDKEHLFIIHLKNMQDKHDFCKPAF
jgi:hypothetical protein